MSGDAPLEWMRDARVDSSGNAHWQADLAVCRAQLRNGSKSFAAAARLLPAAVRDAATVLYAFCRDADDQVDLHGHELQAGDRTTIDALRDRLDRIMAGHVPEPGCDRAMALLVARYQLPRAPLDALIEGFEWDAQGRRYETLDALAAYAARVAGTVGVLMACLMETRSPEALARACELGVAMQYSNIARDVGEDARNGRLYLPREWLREAGIDPDRWLAAPVHSQALAGVVQRLLAEAEPLYARSEAGIAALPAGCRGGIRAARLIYADIGAAVAAAGHDSVTTRAVVPGSRKLLRLVQALCAPLPATKAVPMAPLPAIAFLVSAVARPESRAASLPARLPWWRLGARWLRVIELFERLERNRPHRHPAFALRDDRPVSGA